MRGISQLAGKRIVSQEALCSMQQGSQSVNKPAHTVPSALGACCAIQHFPTFNNCRLQFISAGYAVAGPSGRAVWGVSVVTSLLELRFRISPVAFMYVVLCVSARGFCVKLITSPEESYRLWCVWVWSKASIMIGLGPTGGSDSGEYTQLHFDIWTIFMRFSNK
jgi:hypothetical protein